MLTRKKKSHFAKKKCKHLAITEGKKIIYFFLQHRQKTTQYGNIKIKRKKDRLQTRNK